MNGRDLQRKGRKVLEMVAQMDDVDPRRCIRLLECAFGLRSDLSATRSAAGRKGGQRSAEVRRETGGTANPRSKPVLLQKQTPKQNVKQTGFASEANAEAKREANGVGAPEVHPHTSSPDPSKAYEISPKDPTPSARDGLRERACLVLKDTFGNSFAIQPPLWPEIQHLSAVCAEVWGQAPRWRGGLNHPGLRALLERLAEGHSVAELERAIRGSMRSDHIRDHAEFQTLQTVLKDAGAVEKYTRLLPSKQVEKQEPKPPRKLEHWEEPGYGVPCPPELAAKMPPEFRRILGGK